MVADFDTEIFYFSGTGNSLFIATELSKRIPNCELTPVVSCLEHNDFVSNSKSIGLVIPEHALTIPLVIKAFLKKIKIARAEYIFIVVTRQGTEFLGFRKIQKLLRKQKKEVNFEFVINMYNNDSRHGKYTVPTVEELKIIEKQAIVNVDHIAENVISKRSHEFIDTSVIYQTSNNPFKKWIIEHIVLFSMDVADKLGGVNYFYHDNNCNGCGICEKVCLSRKLTITNNEPVWNKKILCYMCFACLNYCPQKSVQIKSIPGVKSYSLENGRYPHPYAKVKDIEDQKRKINVEIS